jgi:predicted RNA methylase
MKSKKDLQDEIGVSGATLNNWIRLGLIPKPSPDGYYKSKIFEEIIEALKAHPTKLKSRVNRSRNLVKSIPAEMLQNKNSLKILQELLDLHEQVQGTVEASVIAVSLRVLETNNLIRISNNKITFLQIESISFEAFLSNWISTANAKNVWKSYSGIKNSTLPTNEVDFIGTLYQSLRSVSEKSHSGAYYTPAQILAEIKIKAREKVNDPCCGTGRILIQVLSKTHDPTLVFGSDIDPLALNICRINLAIFFRNTVSEAKLEVKDLIFPESHSKDKKGTDFFDVVITNPPWGAKMSQAQKTILRKFYPDLQTTETFSIALYKSLNMLSAKGRLHFILPESFLSVAAHARIRNYVLTTTKQQHIRSYGRLFKGVLSKVIRLDLIKSATVGKTVYTEGLNSNTIPAILLDNQYSRIPLLKNKLETELVLKIWKASNITLKGACTFGLGIVTGNNAKFLLSQLVKNSEPVYTGKEIMPFYFKPAKKYLLFQAENYQQVAPSTLYRKEKICYRFISDKITMVLDTKGTLLLNSANFFIQESHLPNEIIVLLFNSAITTFIYKRIFNSSKVLRNHIENFPIPEFPEAAIKRLMALYIHAIESRNISKELNSIIGNLFGLNPEDIFYIEENFSK